MRRSYLTVILIPDSFLGGSALCLTWEEAAKYLTHPTWGEAIPHLHCYDIKEECWCSAKWQYHYSIWCTTCRCVISHAMLLMEISHVRHYVQYIYRAHHRGIDMIIKLSPLLCDTSSKRLNVIWRDLMVTAKSRQVLCHLSDDYLS